VPQGLASHGFLSVYESGRSDLLRDFYRPALTESIEYCRAVGYFSSSLLPLLSDALQRFVERHGRMRLIISPNLSREDAEAIERGYRERTPLTEPVAASIQREMEALGGTAPYSAAISNLAWLVKHGVIEVMVAVPLADGAVSRGVYHEKLGYFRDETNNVLAFQGSPNESLQAVWSNFESLWVYPSWLPAGGSTHLQDIQRMFHERWENLTPGLFVTPFPDAPKEWLVAHAPEELSFPPAPPAAQAGSRPLRSYQLAALRAWIDAGKRGILSMATGSGKTLVALKAVEGELQQGRSVLIAVPTLALREQWAEEARKVIDGVRIIEVSDRSRWLQPGFIEECLSGRSPSIVLGVMQTLSTEAFLSRATKALRRRPFAVVVDEVHRVGSESWSKLLTLDTEHRMGLSATPETKFDPERNDAVFDYFGSVVYNFDIGQAIQAGVLAPYEYFPIELPLTAHESEEYRRLAALIAGLSRRLASRLHLPEGTSIMELMRAATRAGFGSEAIGLNALLQNRADIGKKASGKVQLAAAALAAHPELRRVLVYCDDHEQLDTVESALNAGGTTTVRYVGEMNSDERALALRAIEGGTTRAVLSMQCLDEGVDIPSCDGALILASSKSWRQFVQRRGRVLRRHEGKQKAAILDPVVVPATPGRGSDAESAMMIGEMHRAWVFVCDAMNRAVAESRLGRIGLKYGISMEEVASDDGAAVG
jgi:superfamily II DNA or RNA helicase